jgi:hypothetical protein
LLYLEVADAELVLLTDTANAVHETLPLPLPVAAAAGRRTVGPGRPGGPARAAGRVARLHLLRLARAASSVAAVSLKPAVAGPATAAAAAAGAALRPFAPVGPGRAAVRVAVLRKLSGSGAEQCRRRRGQVSGVSTPRDGALADLPPPATAAGFCTLKTGND